MPPPLSELPEEEIPDSPATLSIPFLNKVVQHHFGPTIHVNSFEYSENEIGVLSLVVNIDLHFDSPTTPKCPKAFVAKFARPDVTFPGMFQTESFFYCQQQKMPGKCNFLLPQCFFVSDKLILVEKIQAIKHLNPIQGCPPSFMLNIINQLAIFHGQFWNHDCTGLSEQAGIGSALDGYTKQAQFPKLWQNFIGGLQNEFALSLEQTERLKSICESLSTSNLSHVHDAVHAAPNEMRTLIHGDFHISNMLFPMVENDTENTDFYLIDWATCGYGNPLRDFCFFMIVSVKAEDRRNNEMICLKEYYKMLCSQSQAIKMTFDQCYQQYRLCIINQFVILVLYDELSKTWASNAKTVDLQERLFLHFNTVNRRCCFALLDHFVEGDLTL